MFRISYGTVSVLHDLNLEVNPGEVVVLVGPSGCGKTTILNLLSVLSNRLSGSVVREGIIRTVYQHDGLFPWLTVSENISIGLRSVTDASLAHNKKCRNLSSLFILKVSNIIIHISCREGCVSVLNLPGFLPAIPIFCLMDEPFSSLDYQTRLRMRWELVRMLKKGQEPSFLLRMILKKPHNLQTGYSYYPIGPRRLIRELHIDAPRPRGLTDHAVIQAMKEILTELGL